MNYLLKICLGMLTVALLIGVAAPALGTAIVDRRDREPYVGPKSLLLPFLGTEPQQRQAREASLPEPGCAIRADWITQNRRTRDNALATTNVLFPFLGFQDLRRLPLREGVTPIEQAKLEVRGEIANMDPLNNEMVIQFDDAGTSWTVQLDKNIRVFINDEDMELFDLLTGDEVVVVYEFRGFFRVVACEIRCARL